MMECRKTNENVTVFYGRKYCHSKWFKVEFGENAGAVDYKGFISA